MNTQFTCKVSYVKQTEDGGLKRVKELFLVHAPTFGSAEEEIYQHLGESIRGEFNVEAITKVMFHDISDYEDDNADWFEVKVKFLSADDDSGRDKVVTQAFLTTASNVEEACTRVLKEVARTIVDAKISVAKESAIMEVFESSLVTEEV